MVKKQKKDNFLEKQFLKIPKNRKLYKKYQNTKNINLLHQLNQSYSNFVNYTRLLSLIQINVKYKSWHVQKKYRKHNQELVSDELFEYLFNQKDEKKSRFPPRNWNDVLESEVLIEAISKLTQRQQEVLWLLFVEELQGIQAKKRLNVSQQSISKTKKRALNNIQKIWEEKNE